MATHQQILHLGQQLGYHPDPRPGFIGLAKDQRRLDILTYNNPHPDTHNNPRAYLVLCPSYAGRYRVPLVEWPSTNQPARPWENVEEEILTVFGPRLSLPASMVAPALHCLDTRYQLPQHHATQQEGERPPHTSRHPS